MPQRKVCRVHDIVLMSCRCPCPDSVTPMDCHPEYCPKYGQPKEEEVSDAGEV